MRLVVEEVKESVALELNFSYELEGRVEMLCFAPYLFMHNSPAGNFTLTMTGPHGVVYQKTFTSADIKAQLKTVFGYAHVFLPFIPTSPVFLERGDYSVTLSATGYVYNRGSFLGWVRQHEHLNDQIGYTPSNDAENPLAYRLKTHKEGIL